MKINQGKRNVRKRKKIKISKVLLIATTIIVLILAIYLVIFKLIDSKQVPQGPEIAKENIKEEDKEYRLKMAMVGDALIHNAIYKEANINANYNGYDFKPMIKFVKEYIKDYDLAYYNQETILGGSELGLSSYPAFNSPYEVGDAMLDAGFNIVSLATNHTLDRGIEAINNSCLYWNSKKEVLSAGSYCSEEEKEELKVFKRNNITYSMLNYTYGTNGIEVPEQKEYLVNIWPSENGNLEYDYEYQEYKEKVKQDINAIRDKVDFLIVAMHWGVEYQPYPSEYQKDMAQFLANNGVDLVIGTHPHVVEPIEYIDDTLVIYSLGNFISAQENDYNYSKLVGLLTSIDIVKKDNDITIENIDNDLLFTYYDNFSNFSVVPFSKINNNYLDNYQDIYNTYANIVKSIDNTIPVMEVN